MLRLQASGVSVFTAYFDSARAQPNAPQPWLGSDNVIFTGDDPAQSTYDSGAVRLDNMRSDRATVTIVGLTVLLPGATSPFQVWNSTLPLTLPAGGSAIFAQLG